MIGSQVALIAEILLILAGASLGVFFAHHWRAPDYVEFLAGVTGAIVGASIGYEGLINPIAAVLSRVYNAVTNL